MAWVQDKLTYKNDTDELIILCFKPKVLFVSITLGVCFRTMTFPLRNEKITRLTNEYKNTVIIFLFICLVQHWIRLWQWPGYYFNC